MLGINPAFKNTVVLITGGTGTLGNALTDRLLKEGADVVIYSRDEYKQRKQMANRPKNVKYIVGDVRDRDRLEDAAAGADIIIHAAALKHVPTGEESTEETVKTNVLGTLNVIKAAQVMAIKKVVYVSTDKACHPINGYGMSKALSEKLMISAAYDSVQSGFLNPEFVCVRYGNVIGSRGSVIETIKQNKPETLNITDRRMTRFWMTIDQACDIVFRAITTGKTGEIFIPKIKSMHLTNMFKALNPDMELIETGMRPGEKLHEALVNRDESMHTEERKDYFVIKPELLGVRYGKQFEYTSENAEKLTATEFLGMI